MKNFFGSLLAMILSAAFLHADEWPQWMGPQRDNVWREKNILGSFPKNGPKVLWRAPVSNGFSGPAVAEGLVFLTDFVSSADISADNFERKKYTGKERVLCLDAQTGALKWKHEYPATYNVSYPNGPRCTPVVSQGKVWTLGAEGDLFCFETKSGQVHWSRDLKKDYGVEAPLWGFAAHPLLDGDHLICMVGGKGSVTVAFHKDTGKEVWKALSAKEPGYSPPSIIETGKTRQLIIWHPQALNGLDPATGKVYWSVPFVTNNGTSIMLPRKSEDFLFVGAWQNKGGLVQLSEDKPGAKLVWKANRDISVAPVNNTPFVEQGHIYGVDSEGELRCVRLKDGERLWQTYEPVAGKEANSGTAHIVKHEDRFFFIAETGHLIIAKLNPKGYQEISRWKMLEPTTPAFGRMVNWSHPAFAHQSVFARNDKELIRASLAKE